MHLRLCSLILDRYQMKRTYTEAMRHRTFEERFKYLQCRGKLYGQTFGKDRYLNQVLYTSPEWRRFRHEIIIRDNGCDLADPDRPIKGPKILIHHINPITIEQVTNRDPAIFDPENVICISFDTHQAIHYGDERYLNRTKIVERRPNDTCPWRVAK